MTQFLNDEKQTQHCEHRKKNKNILPPSYEEHRKEQRGKPKRKPYDACERLTGQQHMD